MTLSTILNQLRSIDCKAQALISETGFNHYDGLGDQPYPKTDDPEELFLRDYIEGLLDIFSELHEEISYLWKPLHGNHVLELFPDGRYGYFDECGNSNTYHCGDPVEALIPIEHGSLKWVRTRIEHDGTDFYLCRYHSVPLAGLTIRERW